jgi:lipoprotein NlpD
MSVVRLPRGLNRNSVGSSEAKPWQRLLSRLRLVLVAVVLVFAGCATHRPVPVEDRAVSRNEPPRAGSPARVPPVTATTDALPGATYTVKRGDTLHQIALDSGLDYRELAAWNNIDNANRIFPGQVLRLTAPGAPASIGTQESPGGVITAPLRSPPAVVAGTPPSTAPPVGAASPASAPPVVATSPASTAPSPSAGVDVKTSPKAVKLPYSEQAVRDLDLAASAAPAPRSPSSSPPSTSSPPSPSSPPPSGAPAAAAPAPPVAASLSAGDADHLDWAWPAKGKIVSGVSETANLKGIDIAGTAGEAVRASAPGRVVYAGNGLRGYGKLIIIKHNATYLSAYAHNREILVKEGQQVTRGQKIAEMGSTDADQVKLHFEIRRHGKPMDPAKFLPPA